jgi:hypothetical protein
MTAKLTRLTHKIAIQLHLVAESCTILATGGQSGNFWILPRITNYIQQRFSENVIVSNVVRKVGVLYGTRSFITVFTRSSRCTVS